MNFDTRLESSSYADPASFLNAPAQPEEGISLRDLWRVVSRRRKLLLIILLCALALGAGYVAITPRLYSAEAQLEVLKQDAAMGLTDPAQASASMAADALDFNLAVQTYVDVIQSRQLALRVIHELQLDREADYQLRGSREDANLPLEKAPRRMAYALTLFRKRLNVRSVSGTRLIAVSFLDRDSGRAAQIVNQLLADFIDHNYQVRFAASTQASTFLAGELGRMKDQVDSSEAVAVRLQQESGVYGVNETNNATNARLEQLNAQFTTAQANLALRQSIYNLALTRNPEVLAGMIGAQGTGANTANAPLQLLRQQQADAAASYAELNAHYGSQYPRVVQAAEKLKSIQNSISGEVNRLVGQATAEYRVAQDTAGAAGRALEHQKIVAGQMNHDALLYTSAKHEADSNRELYEQLLHRLKEAGVLAGIRSSTLNVLDTAIPPAKFSQPNILIALLASLLGGLFLGCVTIFFVDAVDDRIRDPQRLEHETGLPLLALIPPAQKVLAPPTMEFLKHRIRGDHWLYQATANAPRSSIAEAFRVLRTAILSGARQGRVQTIAITSTSEGEGKSFTTFNLAAAFAQTGRTVLVMDGDLRKNTLTIALGMEEAEGLAESLSTDNWQRFIRNYTELPGLSVLPAGHQFYHPADLLASSLMSQLLRKSRALYDIVLIDTPSIMAVADTVALSPSVDAVIVVAECGVTQQHTLSRTLSVLRRGGARILGLVLNGIDYESPDFKHYWGSQASGYASTPGQMLTPEPLHAGKPKLTPTAVLLGLLIASVPLLGQTSSQKPGADIHGVPKVKKVFLGSDKSLVSSASASSTEESKPPVPASNASQTPKQVPAEGPVEITQPQTTPSSGNTTPGNASDPKTKPAPEKTPAPRKPMALREDTSGPYLIAQLAPQEKPRVVLPVPGQTPEASQQTVLGTGDLLHISVYDAPELTQDVRVSAAGLIHLTLLGDFNVAGMQPDELAVRLEAALREKNLIRQANVSVELKEFTTQGVTVNGEVVKPGIYPVYTPRSVADVLAMASGRTQIADAQVNIRRKSSGRIERITLRQSDADETGAAQVRVFPGDTVTVPRAGYVYVLGSVERPGGYIMRDDGSMTILQAIAEAQGTTKLASMGHVLLLRKENDGATSRPIPLKAMQKGKVPDQRLAAGDILYVPVSGVKSLAQSSAAILASVSGAALYASAR